MSIERLNTRHGLRPARQKSLRCCKVCGGDEQGDRGNVMDMYALHDRHPALDDGYVETIARQTAT
jgi:hypothetical protein